MSTACWEVPEVSISERPDYMTSDQILKLLSAKHSEDVFVPECKDGPTQSVRSFAQMDAWVMPRSWSNPALTAYEIKVSRSDFIGDEKWRKYLPCCNYLYFVAPPGVIFPDELSPEVGYYEVSKTGSRLFLKKKAQFREIEEPSSLFRYVLMARASLREEATKAGTRTFWKDWLEKREIDYMFGHHVSKAIREQVNKEIEVVREKNRELKAQMDEYDSIRKTLKAMGLEENVSEWRFANKLREIRHGLSNADIRDFEKAATLLKEIVEKLKGVK